MVGQEIIYAPCPCGSGKKFKFCCYKKYRHELEDGMTMADVAQIVRCGETQLNDVGRENPESERCHDEGYELMKKGEFAAAREKFRRSRELVPAHSASWNNEASCAWELGDYTAACEIQRAGNASMTVVDSFGLASLATYAHVAGREDEAQAALAAAVAVPPVSVYGALQTCKALALYHRHRDLLDYVAKSGMDDSPRLAYFTGVAHANLEESAAALRDFRRAAATEYGDESEHYAELLRHDRMPWCAVGEGLWPYFDERGFAPARRFAEDYREGRDPLRACPPSVAVDCIYFLQAEGLLSVAEAGDMARRLKGERAKRLADDLAQMAEDEAASDRETAERRAGDVDSKGRTRYPFDAVEQSLAELAELSARERASFDRACDLRAEDCDPDSEDFSKALGVLGDLSRAHPDSLAVRVEYLVLLAKRDAELATGLLDSLSAQHPENVRLASFRIIKAATQRDWATVAEIIDRFALPEQVIDSRFCREWGVAIALAGLCPEFQEKYPEAVIRAGEFVKWFD